jgi:hypothetical protein
MLARLTEAELDRAAATLRAAARARGQAFALADSGRQELVDRTLRIMYAP